MLRQSIPLALAALLAALPPGATLAYDKTQPTASPAANQSAAKPSTRQPAAKLVDLNRASQGELKSLPGIGDAEAAKIVAHRPYNSKTDLVEKKVLTIEAYDRLSKQVVVDHRKPAQKPKS